MRFVRGHVGPDDGYEDIWDIHASFVHGIKILEMLSCYLALLRFGGGHVGPDEGIGDVWDIHANFDFNLIANILTLGYIYQSC